MSQLPNFGKYSIRTEEPSRNLKVGSFYKNLKLGTRDNGTKHQEFTSESSAVANKQDELDSGEAKAQKRHASKESEGKLIGTNAKIQALEDRFNTREKPIRMEDKPASSSTTSPTDSSRTFEDDEDTHESVVVNLNPAAAADSISNESSVQNTSKTSSPPESFVLYTPKLSKQTRKKTYPKRMPDDKILSGVTFVLSGYENPLRSQLREMALQIGATYKPYWCRQCTHLICAFKNTPKYKEVMEDHGRIVTQHWIRECYVQKKLLDWRKFKLGDYPYPDSEEECDVDDDLDYALKTSYRK